MFQGRNPKIEIVQWQEYPKWEKNNDDSKLTKLPNQKVKLAKKVIKVLMVETKIEKYECIAF